MRVVDLLREGTKILKEAKIPGSCNDARWLLQGVLGKSRTELYLSSVDQVDSNIHTQYLHYIERRKNREPVAYILQEQEFWSLSFYICPDVLIPRPETEFMLEKLFLLVDDKNLERGLILDLCTGSGVIATVLAKETGRFVIATDISGPALVTAKRNLMNHNLLNTVFLVQGDLFSSFLEKPVFSLIVSNPPYVSSYDLENNLEPEVSDHEPRLALDGGVGGLRHIKKICDKLPNVLMAGGQFFMEIGADQGGSVLQIFKRKNKNFYFRHLEVISDYSGRDRILYVKMSDG